MLEKLLDKIADLVVTVVGTVIAAHMLGQVPPAEPVVVPKLMYAALERSAPQASSPAGAANASLAACS